MAQYLIEGGLGSGKTLLTVNEIQQGLMKGKRVALNFDLRLDKLLGMMNNKCEVLRIPDQPTLDDLMSIGEGTSSYDESDNGMLIIDECALFLNTRAMGKGGIDEINKIMVHIRKLGWDLYLIIQHRGMLDKQLRILITDHCVSCKRMDRIPIPFISSFLSIFDVKVTLPKYHIGVVRVGYELTAPRAPKWLARGTSLYDCYDTKQKFSSIRNSGVYSMVRPYLTDGRYLDPKRKIKRLIRKIKNVKNIKITSFRFFFITGIFAGAIGTAYATSTDASKSSNLSQGQEIKPPSKNIESTIPDLEGLRINGYVTSDTKSSYIFSKDGTIFYPERLGLKVTAITDCRASLTDIRTMNRTVVTCNPWGIESSNQRLSSPPPTMSIFGSATTTKKEE